MAFRLRPSSADRWGSCPGSITLSEGIEVPESRYALEGSLAHEIAAHILKGKNFLTVPDHMKFHLEVYLRYVKSLFRKKSLILIEQSVPLAWIDEDIGGTGDAVIYDPQTKTLDVVDLKYGEGVKVEPEKNLQLVLYALGSLYYFRKLPVEKVSITIVQPRLAHEDGPVRTWSPSPLELLEYGALLKIAAKRTRTHTTEYNPGKHCRFCPAKAICVETNKNIDNPFTDLTKENAA